MGEVDWLTALESVIKAIEKRSEASMLRLAMKLDKHATDPHKKALIDTIIYLLNRSRVVEQTLAMINILKLLKTDIKLSGIPEETIKELNHENMLYVLSLVKLAMAKYINEITDHIDRIYKTEPDKALGMVAMLINLTILEEYIDTIAVAHIISDIL